MSHRAQIALGDFLGPQMDAKITNTRISLDSERNLAIEADGVTIRDQATGRDIGSLTTVKLGVRALKLIQGQVEVSRIEINDATIDLTRMDQKSIDPLAAFRNDKGQLVGPPLVLGIFKQTAIAINAVSRSANQQVSLNNIALKIGSSAAPETVHLNSLEIVHATSGYLQTSGRASWKTTAFQIKGTLYDANRFTYEIAEFPVVFVPNIGIKEPDGTATEARLKTGIKIRLDGSTDGPVKVIRSQVDLSNLVINTGRNRLLSGSAGLRLELRSDVNKVEVLPSFIRMGSNFTEFNGAIDAESGNDEKNYRFEFVTSRASLKPQNSPEPAVDISGQVKGIFDPSTKTANLSEVGLRTLSGELYGQGSLTFIGTSPRAIFGLRIPKMSVSHAKQIWPMNVAYSARAWVFDHVFGGAFTDSTIDFNIPEGRYGGALQGPLLSSEEMQADFKVSGARIDVLGDLPPLRDAMGSIRVRGANTEIDLESATAFIGNGQTTTVSNGKLLIPYERGKPTIANLDVTVSGEATAVAAIAAREPVNAMRKAPFAIDDLSGSVVAKIKANFPLKKDAAKTDTTWSSDITLKSVSLKKSFDGQTMTEANGTVLASNEAFTLQADAKLNGIPAKIKLKQSLRDDSGKRDLSVQLELNEKARSKLTPGLNSYVKGPIYVDLETGSSSARQVTVDLTKASISLDFAGWSKGVGVPAVATFAMATDEGRTILKDFELSGDSFAMRGTASLDKNGLASADLSTVKLVRGDNVAAKINRTKNGYSIKINGASLDVRALVKKVTGSFDSAVESVGSAAISVAANIDKVTGFNSEGMTNLKMAYSGRGSRVDSLKITAKTDNGGAVTVENSQEGGQRQVQIQSADAGSILRFFDYYDKMRGGSINVALASSGKGPLRGSIDARNFTLVNEPRMRSLVGGKPSDGGPSLKDAVKKDIDVSTVKFSRGSANIVKGDNSLALDNGILRGDLIGLAFRGVAYDKASNINLSGTFMPAYGLNRIFGEIPLLGLILGNGEERGLIGITFKLSGKAKAPQLTVNPISIIAPGIFRQIFEFR